MSFKLKALAAVAAAIAAGPAGAAIDTFASNNGELFFNVHDPVVQRSFVFDLTPVGIGDPSVNNFLPNYYTGDAAFRSNLTTPAINPSANAGNGQPTPAVGTPSNVEAAGTSFSWDIDALSDWNSFVANTDSSRWLWNVVAGDSANGATSTNHTLRYLMTSNSGLLTVDDTTSVNLGQMSVADTQYVVALNNKAGNVAADFNDYNDAAVGGDVVFTNSFQDNWLTRVPAGVSTSLGDAMSFYYMTGRLASTVAVAQYGNAAGAAEWLFRQTAPGSGQYELIYSAPSLAAIPEPNTWAMLSAGLLALGFIARRRVAG